jgi:hypothetical protein
METAMATVKLTPPLQRLGTLQTALPKALEPSIAAPSVVRKGD